MITPVPLLSHSTLLFHLLFGISPCLHSLFSPVVFLSSVSSCQSYPSSSFPLLCLLICLLLLPSFFIHLSITSIAFNNPLFSSTPHPFSQCPLWPFPSCISSFIILPFSNCPFSPYPHLVLFFKSHVTLTHSAHSPCCPSFLLLQIHP